MSITSIFFGMDGKLRSGWRFAIFVLGFLFLGAFLGTLSMIAMSALGFGITGSDSALLTINGLVSLAAALIVGWACARNLESLPFSSLGVTFDRVAPIHFVLGLVAGFVTFAIAAAIGIAAGALSFTLNSAASTADIFWTLLVSFGVFAAAAAFEEALFRGYILQTFVRSDLTWFGVLLTSVLFATVHNANPSATPLSWLNTLIAGVWFAVAYLRTRTLWLPFALHLAWNWTQGSIFGVEVSGLTEIVRSPLMRESDVGPAWITGGSYGIEGGVITTIAIVISTVAIWFVPGRTKPVESD